MRRYIKLDENNKVIAIRFGNSIVEGEIESEAGELGQTMATGGIFTDPEPEPTELQPTLEDKINYLFYKAKGLVD